MTKFTQKYVVARFSKELPDEFEFSMKDWPLHVTLADVFAVDGEWTSLLKDLNLSLKNEKAFFSQTIAKDFFGDDGSTKVILIENTAELRNLHETIISVLEKHGAVFNSPEYVNAGFKPHVTEQAESRLEIGDIVEFRSLTLVDMFPNKDPYQRKILGTVHLK